VQPLHSTWSSSVITISRTPTSSSLKITNRSFQYSAIYLWNQLPESFREPHPHLAISASLPWSCQITVFISVTTVTVYHHFSFTPNSKHTFSTYHFHHRSPLDGLHGTRPLNGFSAKRGRLSLTLSAFERAIKIW